MLTEKQSEEIKAQIISQIESSFPQEKKRFAIDRVKSMTPEELEAFLAKNNLSLAKTSQEGAPRSQQCVFCSIVSGEIDSNKISENEDAIAVLEINPVSRGHVLIIPRQHALVQEKDHEKGIKKLIKNVSSTLKKKLKPKEILTSQSNLFGHETINIIPRYRDEAANTERRQATSEELLGLKALLSSKPKKVPVEKKPRKAKLKPEEKVWLPRRIP